MCGFYRFLGFASFRLLLMALVACGAKGDGAAVSADSMARASEVASLVTDVNVCKAFVGAFEREMLSNGLLEARAKASLPFEIVAMVNEVRVKEGQRVKRGEVLGLLDDRKYVAELENAKIAFEKARIELEDMLLGQGFELKDSARIPKERFRTACVRSGFADAKLSVASAKRALEQTRIVAPIAGVVCNLEAKAHNLSSAFEQFCEITDNSDFQVVFSLLETELQDLNVGQVLRVSPFSMTDCVCRAEVMSVNPLVDEKGMVRVRAVVRAAKTGLLEGMNVKVVLLQRVENCLMVPKSAIVLRQNRKVVFVHENGLAIWKYVTTGLENSEFVQITDGLKAGESAIIDQNFNLAHEGKVKVLADEMAK